MPVATSLVYTCTYYFDKLLKANVTHTLYIDTTALWLICFQKQHTCVRKENEISPDISIVCAVKIVYSKYIFWALKFSPHCTRNKKVPCFNFCHYHVYFLTWIVVINFKPCIKHLAIIFNVSFFLGLFRAWLKLALFTHIFYKYLCIPHQQSFQLLCCIKISIIKFDNHNYNVEEYHISNCAQNCILPKYHHIIFANKNSNGFDSSKCDQCNCAKVYWVYSANLTHFPVISDHQIFWFYLYFKYICIYYYKLIKFCIDKQ